MLVAFGRCDVRVCVDQPLVSGGMARQVKVEPWPQAKQQRKPQARADLDAVLRSELPASGPFRLSIRVRDVQGAQQSGLPDRAAAEPGAARPKGQRPNSQQSDYEG